MVLSNVTAKKETYAQVKNFWKKCGLTIVELTPREHDKQMAMSLGYSYLIGKVGERMGIKKTLIDTYDFQLLLEQTEIVKSDSEELFFAMQTQNPFAKVVRENIEKVMNTLSNEIRRKEVKT